MSESANLITLTPAELESLLERAAERGAMRVLACNQNGNHNENGHADHWLTPEQAAEKLNVSTKWIYRHARKWRFVERLSRKQLRISDAGLRRWMAAGKKNMESPLT
jgi:predicted DNA-binding transcriptional regulator AlpA